MHKHGHSEATYCLKVHQVTTQGVKETKTETIFHTLHKSNLEYAKACSFKGSLPAESAPVHNVASG